MRARTVLTTAAMLTALTGCSASHPPVSPSPAAAASSPDCQALYAAWNSGSGGADFHAVQAAMAANRKTVTAALAANLSPASLDALSTSAATLQAATQTMQAGPPPACVPGLPSDLGTAMAAWAGAARAELGMTAAQQAGDTSTADADAKSAAAQINDGTAAMAAATRDANAFGG